MIGRVVCAASLALCIVRPASAGDAEEALEVEVRGDPIAAPPKDPSVAGGLIREERLRAPGLQASDALRTQPGVSVLETGGYGSRSTASIRGATAAQTPVYLAGIRLNDDVGGTADLSLVPVWLIHRIEIYRSHAPLAGDQLGLGGAIFFEPRRPRTTEAAIGAMAGSFGARAVWGHVGFGDENAGGLLGLRLDGARNDYTFLTEQGTLLERTRDRVATLTNADMTTVDAWALGSLRLGTEGRTDLVANHLEREQGAPGLRLFENRMARIRLTRQFTGIDTRVPCADRGCELEASTAMIVARSQYDDPQRELGLGAAEVEVRASRVEEALLVRWLLSDSFSVNPSLRASIERMAIDPGEATSAHVGRVFSRAAVQAEWTLSELVTLRALASAECHGTSLDGRTPWATPGDVEGPVDGSAICNQLQPAGRVGAQIGSGSLTFLATVGRYARVPTLTELYGLSGSVQGNTALEPETGVSAEAGVRTAAPSTSALKGAAMDLFAFVRRSDRLVSYQRSSAGYVRPFNIGSARVTGVELLASYRPAPFAFLEVATTLLDPRNTSPDRPVNDLLPYQPRVVLAPRLELGSKFGSFPIESGKLSVAYFYEASHYADPAGLNVIPEQGSLDVEAEVSAMNNHVAIRGRVANVFDQKRMDLIGFPLPGRAAYGSLEAKW
jgi:iron complex outermembrane receptor protein